MAPTTYPAGTINAHWETSSGTTILVLRGSGRSASTSPVVWLHGWPGTGSVAIPTLTPWLNWGAHSLLAVGRAVFIPFCSDGWGNAASRTAIDNTLTLAAAGGLSGPPHFIGISMGALNAMSWALSNPGDTASIYGLVPVHDIGAMWDQVTYRSSIETAWGTTGRANVVSAASAVDPINNRAGLTTLGSKVAFYGARDDTVINWNSLDALADWIGATIDASAPEGEFGGGHLFWNLVDGWDEYRLIRHMDANET